MNHRTFLIALATVAAAAMVVGAVDEGPRDGALPPSPPADAPPPGPPLTPQRVDELLESIRNDRPLVYRHLMELRRRDPGQFRRAMAGLDHFFRQLENLPPELREAVVDQRQDRLQRHHLVRRYHATADTTQRDAMAREIRALTGRIFDTDQALREYKVRQLEKEVRALQAQLAARAVQRDTLIDRRVAELLSAGVWDDEGTALDDPRP